jgi:hypothetical protein
LKGKIICRLSLSLLAALAMYWPIGTAGAVEPKPEVLRYKVDVPFLRDAGRSTITLRQIGPDRYEGEIKGKTQGVVGFFTSYRQDRYQTQMLFSQGKFKPLIYLEETIYKGKPLYKEYRFDYEKKRLELWRGDSGQAPVLRWSTELKQMLYDPITAFYNFRLGALGEIKGGETIIVHGIPYPEPEDIAIHIGGMEGEQRKVMVVIRHSPQEHEVGSIHLLFDKQWIPVEAWTRVLAFGKLVGRLIHEPDKPF